MAGTRRRCTGNTEVAGLPRTAYARGVWAQRALLAVLVVALATFGLRASGKAVASLDLADGTVWLANPTRGTVVLVNAVARAVSATVAISEDGESLDTVQDGASVLVLNGSTGGLGRVDGASLSWRDAPVQAESAGALRLLGAPGQAVYLVDEVSRRIRSLDPITLAPRHEAISPPGPLDAMVDVDGHLWVLGRNNGEVLRLDADGRETRQTVELVGTAGLALIDGRRPFVADGGAGRVIGLNGAGRVASDHCLAGGPADALLVGGSDRSSKHDFVVAIAPAKDLVTITDVDEDRCATIDISEAEGSAAPASSSEYGPPVIVADTAFIPVPSAGNVIVVDLVDPKILQTVHVTAGNDFELVADDGFVWFNSLVGPDAGVVHADRPFTPIPKYDVTAAEGSDEALATRNEPGGSADPGDDGPFGVEGAGPGGAPGSPGGGGPGGTPGLERATPVAPPKAAELAVLDPLDPPPSVAAPLAEVTIVTPDRPPAPSPAPIPAPVPAPTPNPAPQPNQPAPASPPTTSATAPTTPARLRSTFIFQPGQVRVGEKVTFTDRSTGEPRPTSWQWAFGDGTASQQQNPEKAYTKASPPEGYLVTLTVSNGREEVISQPARVLVVEADEPLPPRVTISPTEGTVEVDQPLAFTATSSSAVTSWHWDWGDGTKSTGATASHQWRQPRKYAVTVTATNDQNLQGSATALVTVVDKVVEPTASFTFSPARAVRGQPVTFQDTSLGNPTRVTWNFGDAPTDVPGRPGGAVTHTFATSGRTFKVTILVANSAGTSTASLDVAVVEPAERPTANFTVSPPNPQVGTDVLLDAGSSTGNPGFYTWTFSDGSPTIQGGPSAVRVTVRFARPGPVTATLRVRNEVGDSQPVTKTIDVREVPPPPPPLRAEFDVSPGSSPQDQASTGQTVTFVDRSTGGASAWTWEFGDGSPPESGRTVSHRYANPGQFDATLSVSDPSGARAVQRKTVFVRGAPITPPVADFVIEPAIPVAGRPAVFTSHSSPNVTSFSWDFGDGTGSTEPNPAHTYAQPGPRRITLKVTNAIGQEATRTVDLVVAQGVRPPPEPDFVVEQPAAQRMVNRQLTFTDQTLGAVGTATFTFVPGTTISPPPGGRSVNFTYDTPGSKSVRMRVCWAAEPQNCAEIEKTILVLPQAEPPTAAFDVSPDVVYVNSAVTFTDRSTTPAGTTIVSRAWTIGGTAYSGPSVELTFPDPGPVTAMLVVTNDVGMTASHRVELEVRQIPRPTVTVTWTAPVLSARPVDFIAETTGTIAAWLWTIDGVPAGANATMTHTFATPGQYTVAVQVIDSVGQSATHSVVVDVTAPEERPPAAAPDAAPATAPDATPPSPAPTQPTTAEKAEVPSSDAPVADLTVAVAKSVLLIDNEYPPGTDTWTWSWGDGSPADQTRIGQAPHTWATRGVYQVTLTTSGRGIGTTERVFSVRVL